MTNFGGPQPETPRRVEGLVDGLNRPVTADALLETYALAREAYRLADVEKRFVLDSEPASDKDVIRWLQIQLKEN